MSTLAKTAVSGERCGQCNELMPPDSRRCPACNAVRKVKVAAWVQMSFNLLLVFGVAAAFLLPTPLFGLGLLLFGAIIVGLGPRRVIYEPGRPGEA